MKRIWIGGLLLVAATRVSLGASGELVPNAQQVFLGANGTPLVSGFVYTYVPGTTTPKMTWQDEGLTVPNTNPILLDANGQARIWGAGTYRQVVMDASSNLVWDQITKAPGEVSGPSGGCTTNHVVTFGDMTGNLLGCDPTISLVENSLNVLGTAGDAVDASSGLWLPNYTQTTATRVATGLSGAVSDSIGSFQSSFYSQITDDDTTIYTANIHGDVGGSFGAFGPFSGGVWHTSGKNYLGVASHAQAATSSTPDPTYASGVAAFVGDSFQYGAGIGDNEFAAHNPAAGSGSLAQATSLVAVQPIIDASYADADASHVAYGLLVSNVGSKKITAGIGVAGGTMDFLLSGGTTTVMNEAIVMPADGAGVAGTVIDYGFARGNPAGGSYSYWDVNTHGGRYTWVDAGVTLFGVDTKLVQNGYTTPVHRGSGQTTPPALTSCGASPANVGATDTAGTVTMGTGTPAGCVITFNVAYTAVPHCVVTSQSQLASFGYSVSASAITTSQTATDSNKIDYLCDAQDGG